MIYHNLLNVVKTTNKNINIKIMSHYIFPRSNEKTNQTTYYWFKDGLNDEEINKVKEYIQELEFQESVVFSGLDKSVRDSKIKWIHYNSETEWLYNKIYNYAKEANDTIFNFKLFYSRDSIQYSKYSENGKYDWHIDIGEQNNNLRKLSCSILLNDPEEFEGGDFEYWIKKLPEKVPLKKGSVLFFLLFYIVFLRLLKVKGKV